MSATLLNEEATTPWLGLKSWPWLILGAVLTLIAAGLTLPLYAPIGAMYWDSYLYLDAAHRIGTGQLPSVDFFTPVGPLEYYLATWTLALFPNAQPMLAASWAVAWISLPLMALVTWDVTRRSPVVAMALVVPFAVFTLLPFNTTEFYSYPGSDGFGIYNRHASQLLMILTCALLFVRNQVLMAVLVAALMLALFSVKITGFAAGGLLCLVALISGRIHLRTAIVSALVFLAVLAALEVTTAMVSAYLNDMLALLAKNDTGLITRLAQGASRTSGIVLFAGLFALMTMLLIPLKETTVQPLWRATADHPAIWFGAALFVGIFYESQNTGSQELIHLWPIIIMALATLIKSQDRRPAVAIACLAAACALLPPLVQTIQHAARATVAMARQVPLAHDHLGRMGAVMARDRKFDRADRMRAQYVEYAEATRAIALRGELPSHVLYSEHDFQLGLLRDTDAVVGLLKQLEREGLEYGTIMTLDFTNPFPWLLNKSAPRNIAIGADPFRAVPTPSAEVLASIRATDIVLEHQCPYRANARKLAEIYAEALSDHVRVELTECYHALVRQPITEQL